ncbi:hypothetical protein [Actinomadura rayongensis]|uniref:Nucleotidyltransferase family protein n=1 Tax=Actinomadura rayongensis TaxID=1429076 RepID=A0A6I4WAW5_9ACTN|nr:hypothetical protein [Actinomadura rayongensis]MXQ66263.1 hypothetical protein [Actinomadura rayongensis]
MKPWLDLDLLARLLGLPEGTGLRRMFVTALDPGAKLAEPVLSVARAAGTDIGEIGAAWLALTTRRKDFYARVLAELTERCPGLTVLKGPAIDAFYPDDVIRGRVDLDVCAPDVPSLWDLAGHVRRRAADLGPGLEPKEANVSVLTRGAERAVFAGLSWTSPHTALDSVYRVELSTLPFLGDRAAVPPRPGLPASGWTLQLLLVAEEQFQRAVGARDVLDVLMILDAAGAPPDDAWIAATTAARLAPEVAALLAAAADAVDGRAGAGHLRAAALAMAARLAPHADRERRRREGVRDPGEHGTLEYGVPLDDRPADGERLDRHDFGSILRGPLGSHLLVSDLEVPHETYERALAAV